MKFNSTFIIFLLICNTLLCCSSDYNNSITENVQIFGTWKPKYYEYKGKIVNISSCKSKGQIQIVAGTSTGNYKNFSMSSSPCNILDDYDGVWNYNNNSGELKMIYNKNGISQTKILMIETLSSTELKIFDNSENVDEFIGNDEAILVFKK